MRPRTTPMKNNGTAYAAGAKNPHGGGDSLFDVCIVGGGVTGLCAGIFAARRGLATLIITADRGGQTASTAEIENYPGCGRIEGPRLIARMVREASAFGCTMVEDVISHVKRTDHIVLCGAQGIYKGMTLIIATGKSPRRLSVPGEEKFFGRGITFAGVLEPKRFSRKRVAVVGGGSSAIDAATRIAGHAAQVHLIHRRDTCTAEDILMRRFEESSGIQKHMNAFVDTIIGDDVLEAIRIKENGEIVDIPVDIIIVAIGFESRREWYCGAIDCTTDGNIIIDTACRTNVEEIFAAGDCTTVPYQQIVISAGEGAKAALSAYQYVQKRKGKRGLKVDWGYV